MATMPEEIITKLDNMSLQRIDGVFYVTFGRGSDVLKHLELLCQVEMRDDDVLTLGFPRSGNHWAFEVVNMIVHQDTSLAKAAFYNSIFDNMGDEMHEIVGKMASPRVLSSHNQVHRIPSQAIDKKVKIVYLLRNPKDTLVSFFRLLSNQAFESHKFKGTWEDFFQLQMSGDFPWGSWFDHVLGMEAFIKEHPGYPVYIHVFEEMKKDPVCKIKELCAFLGKPDTLAEQIAAATEFTNMKKGLMQGEMKDALEKHTQVDVFFKSGIVGGWKNQFTVAQSEMFNQNFDEKMAGSKLGALVRQYL